MIIPISDESYRTLMPPVSCQAGAGKQNAQKQREDRLYSDASVPVPRIHFFRIHISFITYRGEFLFMFGSTTLHALFLFIVWLSQQ